MAWTNRYKFCGSVAPGEGSSSLPPKPLPNKEVNLTARVLVENTHVQKNKYKVPVFYLSLKNIPRCIKRHMGLPSGVTPCGSKRVMKFWGPKSAKNSPFIKTKMSACYSKKIVVNSLIEIATFQALK